MEKLQFYKMDQAAILPKKKYASDAAFDLFLPDSYEGYKLAPKEQIVVDTGLACAIPEGYWIKFWERSGLASKGIKVSAGVIDQSYLGPWKVILQNTSSDSYIIHRSQAIAQFTLQEVIPCTLIEISKQEYEEKLEISERKKNGFGSSDTQVTK